MIIDGKKIASDLLDEIAQEVKLLTAKGQRPPHLAIVLVGHDEASETYVANKVRACHNCGFDATVVRHEVDVTQDELLATIDSLNRDERIDGYIVQLPLPDHIDEQRIIEAIDYRKDVDGFHPINVGRLALGLPCYPTATPQGIATLLDRCHIATEGKHCVVLGNDNIVGRPTAELLMRKAFPGNCTVTVCNGDTGHVEDITRMADILIAAVGRPNFVKAHMVKEGAVVIDAGTTRLPSEDAPGHYRLYGDVDFDAVAPKCAAITPVPGGVGPMTVVSLMRNTLLAATQEL